MWTSPNLVLRPVMLEDLTLLETWEGAIIPSYLHYFPPQEKYRDGNTKQQPGILVFSLHSALKRWNFFKATWYNLPLEQNPPNPAPLEPG